MTEPAADGADSGTAVGALAPRLDELSDATLIVPIRSSSGSSPDPDLLDAETIRHGTTESGERFIGAFSSPETFASHGPPESDRVSLPARRLFDIAGRAGERVVVDPGAPTQVEVPVGVVPFMAAGIDPNRPDALRARRPLGDALALRADVVPELLGTALREALAALPQVERAWLLRSGDGWTAGIGLQPDAALRDFDTVRNRLHALAAEMLGNRRALAVTDLSAPALREQFEAAADPFYVAEHRKAGFLKRLFGD